MRGIIRSTSSRSGRCSRYMRQPSIPSLASITSNPSLCRVARISAQTTGSSSTTRIVACPVKLLSLIRFAPATSPPSRIGIGPIGAAIASGGLLTRFVNLALSCDKAVVIERAFFGFDQLVQIAIGRSQLAFERGEHRFGGQDLVTPGQRFDLRAGLRDPIRADGRGARAQTVSAAPN